MRSFDTLVFACYLLVVCWLGFRRRRGITAREFRSTDRTLRWVPVGLSVMVTLFSAVNFGAFAGEVFAHGLYVLMVLPAFGLVAWPMLRYWIPYYCRSGFTSAYAYIEACFDVRVRRLAGAIFLLWRLGWMAIVLWITARLLAPVLGLPPVAVVVLGGGLAMAYTMAGGLRAVIGTDVLQFVALMGGLVLAIGVTLHEVGLASIWSGAGSAWRPFHPWDASVLSFDPRVRMSLWSCAIGGTVAFLARYGADHMIVQRYLVSRSVRDARLAFGLNLVCAVIALLGLAFLGLLLAARHEAAGLPAGGLRPLAAVAGLIVRLPAGGRGLLAAALLAATMSSLDSGIHACVMVWNSDMVRRGRADSLGGLRWGAFVIGCLAMLLTLPVSRLGSAFEMANRVINGLGSPLLALFAAGWIGRGFNARGVFWGGVIGTVASIAISFGVDTLALHYYALANLGITLGACWVCSRFRTPRRRQV